MSVLNEKPLGMDKTLGRKWFTFYTKIRPWLSCVMTLSVIIDFFQSTEVYTSYWWTMLYFASAVAQPVLAIMVFVKSQGDYIDFVRFVKGVLLFETFCIAYHQGVNQYLQNGLNVSAALAVGSVICLISFFVWYRLNLKYFTRRILSTKDEYQKQQAFTSVVPPVPPVVTQSVTPHIQSHEATENYKYIKPFFDTNFGTGGISNTRKYIEQQITLAIDNHHVTRKTELMKIIFGDISNRFQNSSSINVDLVIGSFYQIAFDTIIAYNNDTDDFNICCAMTKRFGDVNHNIHQYLRMLVKIQSYIDKAFVSMSSQNVGNGKLAEDMKLQIMGELIAYVDDNSDWNKIANTYDNNKVCFCRKCGSKLMNDADFCGKCGTKII